MAKPLRSALLVLAVAALPAAADDLSSRLEQLEREAAKRAAEAPPAQPDPAAAAEAAPAKPSPRAARLTEIQNRRARAHRELAAGASRRAAAAENSGTADPAQIAKDRREGELCARKAEDVFRPGTAEYQAAYDEWIAAEGSVPAEEPGASPSPEPGSDGVEY